MKVILFGATGMVGQGVLRELVRHDGPFSSPIASCHHAGLLSYHRTQEGVTVRAKISTNH
jgi:uncharacterized protein YbjT (DUF2867 family)